MGKMKRSWRKCTEFCWRQGAFITLRSFIKLNCRSGDITAIFTWLEKEVNVNIKPISVVFRLLKWVCGGCCRATNESIIHLGCLLCCRWRWWRAVWSVQNQGESFPSPEESPTCSWMKTRCSQPEGRPSTELSPTWNWENSRWPNFGTSARIMALLICLWVNMSVIMQQRQKVWKK